ncbi:MAG: PEP-CTERM sorting domain-containing protein [candidate division Zixibacteria bacterium]|nr:PEP-CTERM sorting domain-containing protein [candidate division Zixibacteria bacterium]MDD5425942.1 PEP-CTERM sorting domain-containing protein [candidate division Zixibacteria bacterium]
MKKIIVLAIMFLASTSFAAPWSYHFSDVGFAENPFDQNNDYSYISYPYGIGNVPSPGTQGGEMYDLEGIQVREKNGNIYIAMANSFGWNNNYSSYWRQRYNMGDLFINTGSRMFAIDIRRIDSLTSSFTGLYDVTNPVNRVGIPNIAGGYYGTVTGAAVNAMTPFQINSSLFSSSNNAVNMHLGFNANFEQFPPNHNLGGSPMTYVWEFSFDRALLGDFQRLELSATLACGNDVLKGSYDAIPEPATILLFGLGLIGTGLYRRHKK